MEAARFVAYLQKPTEPSDGRIVFDEAAWVGLSSGAPVVERTAHKLQINAPLVAERGWARRLELRRWLRSEGVCAAVAWGGVLFSGRRAAGVAGGDPVLEDHEVDSTSNSVIVEAPEDDFVTGIRIGELSSEEERELSMNAFFIGPAHTPNTQLFEGEIELEGAGPVGGAG